MIIKKIMQNMAQNGGTSFRSQRVGYLSELCVKTGLRLDLGLTGLSKHFDFF